MREKLHAVQTTFGEADVRRHRAVWNSRGFQVLHVCDNPRAEDARSTFFVETPTVLGPEPDQLSFQVAILAEDPEARQGSPYLRSPRIEGETAESAHVLLPFEYPLLSLP